MIPPRQSSLFRTAQNRLCRAAWTGLPALILLHVTVAANPLPPETPTTPPAAVEMKSAPEAPSAPVAADSLVPDTSAAGAVSDEPGDKPARLVRETLSIMLAGRQERVDVYRPAVTAPDRVAIVAHGFNRSPARHRDLAQALAAAGITALVPALPHVFDLWGNGDAIVELAHRLEAGALDLPSLERSRLVLVGTSAGGLATLLAAAQLPGLAGWIGLDPVDRTGSGIEAAAKLTAPAVVVLGPSSGCNLFGSGRAIARAVPRLLRAPVVKGASHCDFEGPTNRFCEVVCGGSSGEMQSRIRDDTVAAAIELFNDAARRPVPDGAMPE